MQWHAPRSQSLLPDRVRRSGWARNTDQTTRAAGSGSRSRRPNTSSSARSFRPSRMTPRASTSRAFFVFNPYTERVAVNAGAKMRRLAGALVESGASLVRSMCRGHSGQMVLLAHCSPAIARLFSTPENFVPVASISAGGHLRRPRCVAPPARPTRTLDRPPPCAIIF